MSGALATQTPPYPTAIPDGMFRPSAKTVNLSALPSPSVSSRTLMRSRPGPADFRGYSRLSVTQMRPRSSKVIATGFTRSGSLATSSTRNPSGTVIARIASAGDRAGPGGRLCPCGTGPGSWAPDGRASPATTIAMHTARPAVPLINLSPRSRSTRPARQFRVSGEVDAERTRPEHLPSSRNDAARAEWAHELDPLAPLPDPGPSSEPPIGAGALRPAGHDPRRWPARQSDGGLPRVRGRDRPAHFHHRRPQPQGRAGRALPLGRGVLVFPRFARAIPTPGPLVRRPRRPSRSLPRRGSAPTPGGPSPMRHGSPSSGPNPAAPGPTRRASRSIPPTPSIPPPISACCCSRPSRSITSSCAAPLRIAGRTRPPTAINWTVRAINP